MKDQLTKMQEYNEKMLTGDKFYEAIHTLIEGGEVKLSNGTKVNFEGIHTSNDKTSGEHLSYGYTQSEVERKQAEEQGKAAIANLDTDNAIIQGKSNSDGSFVDANGNVLVPISADTVLPNFGMTFSELCEKLVLRGAEGFSDIATNLFTDIYKNITNGVNHAITASTQQPAEVNVSVNVPIYGNLDNVTQAELIKKIYEVAPKAVSEAFGQNIGKKGNLRNY
jgi:hypothetical protein